MKLSTISITTFIAAYLSLHAATAGAATATEKYCMNGAKTVSAASNNRDRGVSLAATKSEFVTGFVDGSMEIGRSVDISEMRMWYAIIDGVYARPGDDGVELAARFYANCSSLSGEKQGPKS